MHLEFITPVCPFNQIDSILTIQDEKPACYEGSLLGLWIGEDAIPCTPGVTKVRSRTKINMARYVAKLAIQFLES